MKKQFLLLLWMTLLPLAGWATKATLQTVPSLATMLFYTGDELPLLTGEAATPSNYSYTPGCILYKVTTGETAVAPTNDDDAVTIFPTRTDAGKYYVWYRVKADGDEFEEEGEWTQIGTNVRINKATPTITEPRVATGLKFTNEAQQLILTKATASLGTVKYNFDGGSTWYDDITSADLKKTDAGTYTIHYQVAGTDNWYEANGTIVVTIAKLDPDYTAPEVEEGLTYINGTAQQLIKTAGTVTTLDNSSKMQYSVNGSDWYDAIDDANLKKTDASDDYKVYYRIEETTNYNAVASAVIPVSIAKKSLQASDITAFVNSGHINQTYRGTDFTEMVAGWATVKDGEVKLSSGTDYKKAGLENALNVPAADATDEQKPRMKLTGLGNYKDDIYVYFNILPRDITDNDDITVTLNGGETMTYKAADWEPSIVVNDALSTKTSPLAEDEFKVAENGWNNNKAAGTNTASVTIEGTGNYKGTKTFNFSIAQAQLEVKAKDAEKVYGETDPTPEYEITGFIAPDTKDNVTITGTPSISRTDTSEDVGSYSYTVDVSGMSTTNYSIVAASEQGSLTIKKASVFVRPQNVKKTYGYKLPALNQTATDFEFKAEGLKSGHNIATLTFTVTDKAGTTEYAKDDMLEAGDYTITVTAATTSGGDYDIDFGSTATLTIKPLEITISSVTQEINDGEEPKQAKDTAPDTEGNYTSWTNNLILMDTEDNSNGILSGEHIGKSKFQPLYGKWKEDFVESLTWEPQEGYTDITIAHPGVIKVNLKSDYDKKNFVVETFDAPVIINKASSVELARANGDVLDIIKNYDKQTVDVSFDRPINNAETWYTMVLPFETSPAELTEKFGYVVVNVLNEKNADPSTVKFKLHMQTIEANQPFLIKVASQVTGAVNFTDKVITYVETPERSDIAGNKYIGTYAVKALSANVNWWAMNSTPDTDDAVKNKFVKLTSGGPTLRPFEAYLETVEELDAFAPVIFIEDMDGSTTAINAITDNTKAISGEGWYTINGVRLQGAPTEKGVYIQNGKKIVIK